MLLLAFILFQTELPHYDVVVDPSLLDELVSDPSVEMEIPAVISYDGVSGECTIAFRGGTSLSCAKKSWHITVSDSYLFPDGGHILLNAQFRDASLMRNTLGLWITRKLGYPSPQTEFAAQGCGGVEALSLGAYLHGLSADILSDKTSSRSILPTEVADNLGSAISMVENRKFDSCLGGNPYWTRS